MHEKVIAVGRGAYRAYRAVMSGFITVLVYGLAFVFALGLSALVVGFLYQTIWPDEKMPVGALSIAAIPALGLIYLLRRGAKWRRDNPVAYAAELAAKHELGPQAADMTAGGVLKGFVDLMASLVAHAVAYGLAAVMLGVLMYAGYLIVTSLSVPLAIIIGAVIIGFCILAARS